MITIQYVMLTVAFSRL